METSADQAAGPSLMEHQHYADDHESVHEREASVHGPTVAMNVGET